MKSQISNLKSQIGSPFGIWNLESGILGLLLLLLTAHWTPLTAQTPVYPVQYTVAGLPSASTMRGRVVHVTDSIGPGRCDLGGGVYRTPCYSNGTKWTPWSAGIGPVPVSLFATGGLGTSASPWTGWDTAITWSARTEYFFRSGWYSYATSPNFLKEDIAIVGEAGTYLKHTGTGAAFKMDSGAAGSLWVHRVRVENFTIVGNYFTLTGTASASSGGTAVVGSGTSFTTQLAVGDSISFGSGMTTETRIITNIADNTHLTVGTNWAVTWSAGSAIKGGKSTYGLDLIGVRNGTFRNISVKDVGVAALRTTNLVTNTFEDFVYTYHEPTQSTGFNVRAQYGVLQTSDTTTSTFSELVIEGAQLIGIWFQTGCYGNTVVNGTSEGNPGKGAVIDSELNTIINTDFEANDDTDIVINQSRNTLDNVVAAGDTLIALGQASKIIGGNFGNLTITADFTHLIGALVTGTFTDTSGTPPTTFRFGNQYTLGGGFQYDSYLGNVLPRALSLSSSSNHVATDSKLASAFYVPVLENTTLDNPTNPTNGQTCSWVFEGGGSGPYTIGFGSAFEPSYGETLPTVIDTSQHFILVATYSSALGKWMVSKNQSKLITLNDSAVAHGMTDVIRTNVFGQIAALSGTAGGVDITALSDSDASAVRLRGVIGSSDPTDSTPAILLRGEKKNSTDTQALGNAETVLQVTNKTTDLLTVLGDGKTGIGTANPQFKGHIVSTSAGADVKVLSLQNASSDASTAASLNFNPTALTSAAGIGSVKVTKLNASTDYTSKMDFAVTDSGGSNVVTMTLLGPNGYAGIGITPTAKLHVNGSVIAEAGFRDKGTTISRFENTFAAVPTGSTGNGVEIGIVSGTGTIQAFDRTGGVRIPMDFSASAFSFSVGGVVVGSPTGGNKGGGTVNATAVYDDNVLLTDWVFRNYYRLQNRTRPQFSFTAAGAPHRRLFSLAETRSHTVRENRLPWMPTVSEFEKARSVGGMVTRLWQGQEQQQLYIQELEDRIKRLEAMVSTGMKGSRNRRRPRR